jgi:hypothetical protein
MPNSEVRLEIRTLFASDPVREAIFLVAGDKSGNWDGWYREAVPLADERYTPSTWRPWRQAGDERQLFQVE